MDSSLPLGLTNPGNTSFANGTLQTIFHIPLVYEANCIFYRNHFTRSLGDQEDVHEFLTQVLLQIEERYL